MYKLSFYIIHQLLTHLRYILIIKRNLNIFKAILFYRFVATIIVLYLIILNISIYIL